MVWRHGPDGREWLILHRGIEGPEYEGDWAWSPPGGRLEPGEEPASAAARELHEETGLDLPLIPAPFEHETVAFFLAEAPAGAEVRLSPEHDRHAWLSTADASARCLPEWVGALFAEAG